jgi:hypothetical protein
MASVNHPIVVIDDLDSTTKHGAFDCFVLNRYGNYDKTTAYNYFHANVIDICGVCTYLKVPLSILQRQGHKRESLEN